MSGIRFDGPAGNGGAAAVAVAERFAEEDARRREFLDRHTRIPFRCPGCGNERGHHPKCKEAEIARGRPAVVRQRRVRQCQVPGCYRPEKRAGICTGHLRQRERGLEFRPLGPPRWTRVKP